MKDDQPEAIALIAAVRAAIVRARAEMALKLDAAGIIDPDMRSANELQNVLRICIAVCFNETPAMSEELPVQIALRAASYALSALPPALQEQSAHFVAHNLPSVHQQRREKRIGIESQWVAISTGTGTKQ